VSITIGNGVTVIGGQWFSNGSSHEGNRLTSLTIGSSVTVIEEKAFHYQNLMSVVIPDNVTHIGIDAFSMNVLTSVTLGSGVTHIDVGAFYDNPGLATIRFRSATPPEIATRDMGGGYIFTPFYFIHPDARAIVPPSWADHGIVEGQDWYGLTIVFGDGSNLAPLTLTKCYRTETITATGTDDFSGYAVAVEVGGRARVAPLFGDTLDISRLIPRNASRTTRIALMDAHAVPDVTERDLTQWSEADRLSEIITLLPRGARMDRNELTIDYAAERITGTGTYYFRERNTGTWQTITFSGDNFICIAGFAMGGALEVRRGSTATAAAGATARLSVRGRQRAPNVSIRGDRFHGVNANMEFSTDGGASWANVTAPMMTEGHTGTILFRARATERAMRSFATAFTMMP
jgi:hypothetical protein